MGLGYLPRDAGVRVAPATTALRTRPPSGESWSRRDEKAGAGREARRLLGHMQSVCYSPEDAVQVRV
jgi:hypothetical protein